MGKFIYDWLEKLKKDTLRDEEREFKELYDTKKSYYLLKKISLYNLYIENLSKEIKNLPLTISHLITGYRLSNLEKQGFLFGKICEFEKDFINKGFFNLNRYESLQELEKLVLPSCGRNGPTKENVEKARKIYRTSVNEIFSDAAEGIKDFDKYIDF